MNGNYSSGKNNWTTLKRIRLGDYKILYGTNSTLLKARKSLLSMGTYKKLPLIYDSDANEIIIFQVEISFISLHEKGEFSSIFISLFVAVCFE